MPTKDERAARSDRPPTSTTTTTTAAVATAISAAGPQEKGVGAPVPTTLLRLPHRLQFWRSPPDQPRWAQPTLLDVATLAALSYGWGMNQAQLEPFYGAAARSMSQNWHNFIFGAFDPWGTVSVDKLPGALWLQALSLRVFGFHVWAIVLPQVAEGTLTVLVLYRAVRRVTGAGAGLASAVVMTTSPIVLLLDHGNISDSLLILLLVLAADATTRAFSSGRARYLLWAGLWVGLAFQTKMIQAWLVLPALYLAYLVVSPVTRLWRRLLHVALSTIVVAVISLSWMTAVSIVPAADRPYVDGSCDNSLYSQVFEYNGLERLEGNLLSQPGCFKTSPYVVALYRTSAAQGINTGSIGPAWDRLLKGVFGHDDAWLLFPAAVSAVGLALRRRRKPRTDPVRAALLLWSAWFLIDFAFFSAGTFINSYYVAALIPAVAALCGMGAVGAWRHRSAGTVRIVLAATTVGSVATTVALIPDYVGLRNWIIGSTVVVGTPLSDRSWPSWPCSPDPPGRRESCSPRASDHSTLRISPNTSTASRKVQLRNSTKVCTSFPRLPTTSPHPWRPT